MVISVFLYTRTLEHVAQLLLPLLRLVKKQSCQSEQAVGVNFSSSNSPKPMDCLI